MGKFKRFFMKFRWAKSRGGRETFQQSSTRRCRVKAFLLFAETRRKKTRRSFKVKQQTKWKIKWNIRIINICINSAITTLSSLVRALNKLISLLSFFFCLIKRWNETWKWCPTGRKKPTVNKVWNTYNVK